MHTLTSCALPCRAALHRGAPRGRGLRLLNLPDAFLCAVLHKAGPRSREVCRALMHVYGPLTRLTPQSLDTPEELLSAVAMNGDALRHLTTLDLSHAHLPITGDELLALCKALPNLRCLRLPSTGHCLTLAEVAAATQHLPSLAELHAPFLSDSDLNPEQHVAGWSHVRALSLPIDLVTQRFIAALRPCSELSSLSFRGHAKGWPPTYDVSPCVTYMTALVSLELDMGVGSALHGRLGAAQLERLAGLTSLKLALLDYSKHEEQVWAGKMLRHVGALTTLKSLHLVEHCQHGWTPAEHGWLSRLTRLTRLAVAFPLLWHSYIGIPSARSFDEVAAGVPFMPALAELHMSNEHGGEEDDLSDAACACIASASSTLRLLDLKGVCLPASFSRALLQLTGLTCLRLHSWLPDDACSALPALTNLRELMYVDRAQDGMAPSELLAGLPAVDTLLLSSCMEERGWDNGTAAMGGRFLARLCDAMPQLRRLKMCRVSSSTRAAMAALGRLTNLEVLCFSCGASWLGDYRAPSSLRRCYLGAMGPEDRLTARALLGRHVEAVFSTWHEEGVAW
jgi:hypothetical protein